jgi:hypothetical protein
VAGALVCYAVSRHVGRRAVLRWGRHIHVTPHRLEKAERWLARRGWLAIFVARVLPGTRINASIAAGCLRLPLRSFAGGVLPSTVIWLGGFTLLGFLLGDSVTPYLPWFDRAVGAAITVAVVVAVALWWRRRRRRAAGRAEADSGRRLAARGRFCRGGAGQPPAAAPVSRPGSVILAGSSRSSSCASVRSVLSRATSRMVRPLANASLARPAAAS